MDGWMDDAAESVSFESMCSMLMPGHFLFRVADLVSDKQSKRSPKKATFRQGSRSMFRALRQTVIRISNAQIGALNYKYELIIKKVGV